MIYQMENDFSGAAELFQHAAQQWIAQGDAKKAADAYDNAAAEVWFIMRALFPFRNHHCFVVLCFLSVQLENVNDDAAVESYERGMCWHSLL